MFDSRCGGSIASPVFSRKLKNVVARLFSKGLVL